MKYMNISTSHLALGMLDGIALHKTKHGYAKIFAKELKHKFRNNGILENSLSVHRLTFYFSVFGISLLN